MSYTIVFANGNTIVSDHDNLSDTVAQAQSLETVNGFKWDIYQEGYEDPVYAWVCIPKYPA